jgi:hypothetical protein
MPGRKVKMRKMFFILAVLTGLIVGPYCQALPLQQSLGMFESGATHLKRGAADLKRGQSGEVSRYQIMPEVWRQYSQSREYDNPEVSWAVAQRILQDRVVWFRNATGRHPDALELYLLWNKPGHFEAVGFKANRVKPLYKDRAQRFANIYALK